AAAEQGERRNPRRRRCAPPAGRAVAVVARPHGRRQREARALRREPGRRGSRAALVVRHARRRAPPCDRGPATPYARRGGPPAPARMRARRDRRRRQDDAPAGARPALGEPASRYAVAAGGAPRPPRGGGDDQLAAESLTPGPLTCFVSAGPRPAWHRCVMAADPRRTAGGGPAGGGPRTPVPSPRFRLAWWVAASFLALLLLNYWAASRATQAQSRVRLPYSPVFLGAVHAGE